MGWSPSVPLLFSGHCIFAASGAGSTIPHFSDTTGHLTLIFINFISLIESSSIKPHTPSQEECLYRTSTEFHKEFHS